MGLRDKLREALEPPVGLKARLQLAFDVLPSYEEEKHQRGPGGKFAPGAHAAEAEKHSSAAKAHAAEPMLARGHANAAKAHEKAAVRQLKTEKPNVKLSKQAYEKSRQAVLAHSKAPKEHELRAPHATANKAAETRLAAIRLKLQALKRKGGSAEEQAKLRVEYNKLAKTLRKTGEK